MLKVIKELLSNESSTVFLSKDKKVYRARKKDNSLNINDSIDRFQKELGSPPQNILQNNRMSPVGINYTYVGSSLEVCIYEIKPKVNDEIYIGEFQVIKDLKILDLSSIPNFPVKSIFAEDYDSDMVWAKNFMIHFTNEISKPIDEQTSQIEYVPTQLLSEYIRKSYIVRLWKKKGSALCYYLLYGN